MEAQPTTAETAAGAEAVGCGELGKRLGRCLGSVRFFFFFLNLCLGNGLTFRATCS